MIAFEQEHILQLDTVSVAPLAAHLAVQTVVETVVPKAVPSVVHSAVHWAAVLVPQG